MSTVTDQPDVALNQPTPEYITSTIDIDPQTIPTRADYKSVRQELTRLVGRDKIVELSKGNIWADLWWGLWPPASVIILALAIGFIDNWWIRVPLIALNGFAITNCANVGHSMCSHRRPFGKRGSQIHGTILHTTAMLSFSIYTASHTYHHNNVNTPADQDFDLVDLNKRWKRLIYTTFLGYVVASTRAFAPKSSKHLAWNARGYFRKELMADPARRKDVIFEAIYVAVFWTAIIAGCFWKPEFFLLGYVVPLLATAALANAFREAIEHQGVNIADPWQIASSSRPGPLRRALLHQAGTTHWVHHMWPNIPHYKCVEAWDLFYPHLQEHGIVENRSFLKDLKRYYVDGQPRAHWVDPATGEDHQIQTLTAYGDPVYVAAHK